MAKTLGKVVINVENTTLELHYSEGVYREDIDRLIMKYLEEKIPGSTNIDANIYTVPFPIEPEVKVNA